MSGDPLYATVAAGDFSALMAVDRYRPHGILDPLLEEGREQHWDPRDPDYIAFTPFPTSERALLARSLPELAGAVRERLDEGARIRFANDLLHWFLSGTLHLEQAALSLNAGLCRVFRDKAAQEYAANQAREEARHVDAFARYIAARWGAPLPPSLVLHRQLCELVTSLRVDRQIVAMHILMEGLAMGVFATLHAAAADPVLKRLTQLVMTDESLHHRFGKLWAERSLARLDEAARRDIEEWVAHVVRGMLLHLTDFRQKQEIYARHGLDWRWVRDAVREARGGGAGREALAGRSEFHPLARTLLRLGLVTERTRSLYARWIDFAEAEAADDRGEAVAAEGAALLRGINAGRKRLAAARLS